jgi:hypothetical protein
MPVPGSSSLFHSVYCIFCRDTSSGLLKRSLFYSASCNFCTATSPELLKHSLFHASSYFSIYCSHLVWTATKLPVSLEASQHPSSFFFCFPCLLFPMFSFFSPLQSITSYGLLKLGFHDFFY